jgi:anti-sigma-K factor RskA
MNIRHNEDLREKLAAQYVLGTLRAGARRRFESWLHDDAALRLAVAEWQDRLHPMAEFVPALQPAPQVWQAIEQKLDLRGAYLHQSGRSFWRGLHEDVSFWRGLGLVSTAIATILVAVLATKRPEPAPLAGYIAMLADDRAQPVAVVTGDPKRHQLIVQVVARQTIATDKSLQLWAVPRQGAPRSLGLVAADGTITLTLPENATPQSIPLLAISLEPKGGSPDPKGPTGPILYKGPWVQI